MDASIRFKDTGNFSHIKNQLLQTDGILQMVNVAHSIYVATHKQLYEYFPTDIEKTKRTREYYHLVFLTCAAHALYFRRFAFFTIQPNVIVITASNCKVILHTTQDFPGPVSVSISAMGGATMITIYRTEHAFKNNILFWVLCALDENCAEPTRYLKCNHTRMEKRQYAGKPINYFSKLFLF